MYPPLYTFIVFSVLCGFSDVVCVNKSDSEFVVVNSDLYGDSDCQFLLESFASVTANFTFCAIRHARPIRLCESCVDDYMLVIEVHKDILKLEDEGGEPCKEKLLNLDRLQVVEAGFEYVQGLWKRANCDYCFKINPDGSLTKKLNNHTLEILNLHKQVDSCIQEHRNDSYESLYDPLVCTECKESYLYLNNRYNELKDHIFCMDIVDLINTTRNEWSVELGCCLDRQKPEIVFLITSGVISLIPILFYASAYLFATKKEEKVAQQKRWVEHVNIMPSSSQVLNTS